MAEERSSILNPDINEAAVPDRTIALVGMMGVGKTSVGRRLASALNRPFFDSDDEIEKAAGMSVATIFSVHGEQEFRRGEQRVLERLLSGPPHVLATGGGAYLNPKTRDLMRENAVTVWLNAELETLWKRVSRRSHRPLLRQPNPRQTLSNLLDERRSVYQLADVVVTSVDGPHSITVDAILTALKKWNS